MKNKIYRQIAIDRLSSPEQLDQVIHVTHARLWLSLAACLLLLTAAVVWGVMGSVVTTASGTGVIVRQGGVLNIVTNGSGIVLQLHVAPGAMVKRNEVVATIAQPALYRQLQLLQSSREEAVRVREQRQKMDQDALQLKLSANERQKSNAEALIREQEARARLLTQQIEVERQLHDKGLVTNQQVLDLEQKRVELNDQIAATHAQMRQLEADRYGIESEPRQLDVDRQSHIAELERQIDAAKGNLELAENVVSPYEGEVLEVKTTVGGKVAEGQPILSLQTREENLDVLAYIPSQIAKDVRAEMEAQISPSNVKREEYGYLHGKVEFVASYPATEAAIMRNFENDSLVHIVTSGGLVTEIHATIQRDADTKSGFAWSTSKGPDVPITSGTICTVDVVTRRERPILLVLPFLKSSLAAWR